MKDREFLTWIHDRLHNKYGVDCNTDYMHKLRSIILNIPKDQHTINIVNDSKMPEEKEVLKPCPFCGGEAKLDNKGSVVCLKCPAFISYWYDNPVKIWNTRQLKEE